MNTTSIIEQERKEFEKTFSHMELDKIKDAWGKEKYKHEHIESIWYGWQAARQSSQSEPAATADYIAYLYSDGNKLKIAEEMPPPDNAFPVFTTKIRFLDVARLVLSDNVDLILEHGGVKLWEALVTKVNKDYADSNLAAPQQAIPSGYALVPNEVLVAIKNLPRFSFLSPLEGGVRRFADTSGNWIEQYEVIKLIDDYIHSASPTAPIERDK
ncbi:MAG TPA: hypothetical protein VL943_07140 [Niabella sp.]|nr:hypothetical protein [Niabella sp.]